MSVKTNEVIESDQGDLSQFDGSAGESFWARNFFRVWFALSIIVLVVYFIGSWIQHRRFEDIVITSGAVRGTYFPLGKGLETILRSEFGTGVSVKASSGSGENVARLMSGEATVGFVQNDFGTDSTALRELSLDKERLGELRTIAVLYDEVLQVVVRKDAVEKIITLSDLRGKTVNLGPPKSGTHRVARRLLEHYGLRGDEDFVEKSYALDEDLSGMFKDGSLDVAFYLAGLKTKAVGDLLAAADVELLSLGSINAGGSVANGAVFDLPGTKSTVIPEHTYGTHPEKPIATLAVEALLVTTSKQRTDFVYRVAEAIFQNRYTLIERHGAAAQIRELGSAQGLRFAVHPGALRYYARNEPPFVVKYAQTLSFLLALFVSATSGVIGFITKTRKNKKDKIDVYYLKVEKLAEEIFGAPSEVLQEVRRKLLAIRREALHDLVGEKIKADTSFLIFQDFLGQLLSEIRQTLEMRAKDLTGRIET